MQTMGCAHRFHIRLVKPPTHPLRPIIPNNACPPRITAAAGTKLAGASSSGTVIIVPIERSLRTEVLHHPRGVAASDFRPLRKIPHRSEEHTSELQSRQYLVCRLLLEKKTSRNRSSSLLDLVHRGLLVIATPHDAATTVRGPSNERGSHSSQMFHKPFCFFF